MSCFFCFSLQVMALWQNDLSPQQQSQRTGRPASGQPARIFFKLAMSNQRSFKIDSFCLLLSFLKIPVSNIFVFETKFWIETKRFLSVLKIFGPKAFVLFHSNFFKTAKSFFFVFKKPWCNLKRFGFVLISFFKNTKVMFWIDGVT